MSKKILICDDDPDILEVTRLILEEEGYEALAEQGSYRLIERVLAEMPDLLLLDLWMPVLPGDELTRQIRHTPEIAALPIVVFSATREGESRAVAAGANGFITKPFSIETMVATIESCLP